MKNELILTFDASAVNKMFHEGMNDNCDLDQFTSAVIIQPRHMAETSLTTRHPIPYVVLMDEHTREILLYRRGAKVGESRLSGNASCGFGGHVDVDAELLAQTTNRDDKTFLPSAAIQYTADKELSEELGVDLRNHRTEVIGILRDDSNEVGVVHLGVIMIKWVDRQTIDKTNEDELDLIGWAKLDRIDVDDISLNLENWSKMTISHLQTNGK